MSGKGYAIASVLTVFGLYFLTLHLVFNFAFEFVYAQLAFALLFTLAGMTIFIRITVRAYEHRNPPPVKAEFKMINSDVHFFVLEFAKVTSAFLLGMEYPLEGLVLFLILDVLDGWVLPHRKRSLIIRHRIDKFTDFLCQIPFYLAAVKIWSQLIVVITIFFIISFMKTIFFVKSGNRNWLIILPGFFPAFCIFGLITIRFFSDWSWIFTNFYAATIFIVVIMLVTVLYEVAYNGVLCKLRYRRQGAYYQL